MVQVEVRGKLPQVRFALGWLVDLKEQVDGVLPVSVWRAEVGLGVGKENAVRTSPTAKWLLSARLVSGAV